MDDTVYPHNWSREGFLGDFVVTLRPHPINEYTDVTGPHAPTASTSPRSRRSTRRIPPRSPLYSHVRARI